VVPLDALDVAITSHINLMVRTPTIAIVGARVYRCVRNRRKGLPALESGQLA